MMGYIDKIDEWRKKAKDKAKELDEKYKLKDRLDDGVKAAGDAVKKGAESVSDAARFSANAVSAGAQAAQAEFSRLEEEHKVKEKAGEAFRTSKQAASDAFKTGKARASDLGDKARNYYEKASEAYNFGAAATRATGSLIETINSSYNWVKENPGKATIVTLSLVAGTRLGALFPKLDVVIIGREGHWFFRSALLAYSTRKLSEKYLKFLKSQEELIAEGKLTEAERKRVEFQRSAAKYVGAPLLGAFNIAAGVAMWGEIFSPGRIVGFPIDIILGGNPALETIWLFANGLICIHNGYEFIMMAIADQEEVQQVVRDIKGLLPSAPPAA
jgi:hypothetical protein